MKAWLKRPWAQLMSVLVVAYAACFGLYLYALVFDHLSGDFFLVVSLVLAALPLLLAWRLSVSLRQKLWSSWEPLALTLLWLIFLPGSFYGVSDYIHLQAEPSGNILFTVLLYSSFIMLALMLGLASLYLVHTELKKRLKGVTAAVLMAIILLGVSFAIYVGRDLSWNSWDVALNPGGLLFDISNLVTRVHTYPAMIRTVFAMFVLLGSVYLVVWRSGRMLWHRGINDLAAHIKRSHNN